MRVVHVATYGNRGGAARGATDVHRSLLDAGVDSWMVVAEDPADVRRMSVAPAPDDRRRGLNRRLEQLFTGGARSTWSLNVVPSTLPAAVRAISPDIVNVHWVADGGLVPTQLGELGAPVVWTLRDMWPMTGGCHYDEGCGRFEIGCGRCPQIRLSLPWDASTLGLRQRRRGLSEAQDLVGVALSQWLAGRASASPLWRDRRIEVITPGVDGGTFRPADRVGARARFGLPPSSPLVGFIALHPYDEPRKGWNVLQDALGRVRTTDVGRDAAVVVTADEAPRTASCPVLPVGRLDSLEDLRHLYAACDTVAVPSLEEAFGKVALEALSTGTSVVTFSETGAADVVEHRETGWVARHGDAGDLARGLEWALARSLTPSGARALHERTQRDHSLARRARDYEALYLELARG